MGSVSWGKLFAVSLFRGPEIDGVKANPAPSPTPATEVFKIKFLREQFFIGMKIPFLFHFASPFVSNFHSHIRSQQGELCQPFRRAVLIIGNLARNLKIQILALV